MLIRQSMRYSTDLIFKFEYDDKNIKEVRCRMGDIIRIKYNLNGLEVSRNGTITQTMVSKVDTYIGYMKISCLNEDGVNYTLYTIHFRDILDIDLITSNFGITNNYECEPMLPT